MFASRSLAGFVNGFDCAPWGATSGRHAALPLRRTGPAATPGMRSAPPPKVPLYTPAQRARRDASRWTLVQGALAPAQFAVFLVSLLLVLRCLATGAGAEAATASVAVKTVVLYAIMVTGAFWERDVFGRYLFAPAFFWEDALSILVLALHTAYLVALGFGLLDVTDLLLLALAGYAAYLANAAQYVLKLRTARSERGMWTGYGALDPAE